MTPITRARALEIAQECISFEMMRVLDRKFPASPNSGWEEVYAELAAALAYIENMARQKELL